MPIQLRDFGYHHVELKESHFRKQRDEVVETYLAIDNDDLLHYYRALAGLPDDAYGLTGWYGNNASTFGQMLGAFARLYLETGDRRLYNKAVYLSDEWGVCARSARAVIDVNGTYAYDKLMGGFLDMLELLHYEPAREYILELTQSAARRFDRTIARDGLQVMPGNMIEWYTLPEQLYRAYQCTGEQIYYDFAKEWDYTYLWNKLLKRDYSIGPRHAYSLVNSLSSAMRAYETTGDASYLEATEIAYEEILAHHTFATGGYGPAECLFAEEEGYLGDSLKANWDMDRRHHTYRDFGDSQRARDDKWGSCEVSCCSWAVFKLTNYLLKYTGDAKYADWEEKLLYNGCGGQLPVTRDGRVMYYADYYIDGAIKSVEDGRLQADGSAFEWQCCTGTFPEDVAEYSNMLYYYDEKGIYAVQYLPSKVDFTIDGAWFSLVNTSFYPKEKSIRFVVRSSERRHFLIRLRIPSWAVGDNSVTVNGQRLDAACEANTWLVLDRTWGNGDEIILDCTFVLRFEAADEYAPDVAALCYGPLVLVCDHMTLFQGDIANPASWIEPIQKDGYSYAFRTKPGHVVPYAHLTRDFYPYYEVPAMEWYYMYSRIRPER